MEFMEIPCQHYKYTRFPWQTLPLLPQVVHRQRWEILHPESLFSTFLFLGLFFLSLHHPLSPPTISFPACRILKSLESCWALELSDFEAEKGLFGITARAQHRQAGQAQAWSSSFVLKQDLTLQNQINPQLLSATLQQTWEKNYNKGWNVSCWV